MAPSPAKLVSEKVKNSPKMLNITPCTTESSPKNTAYTPMAMRRPKGGSKAATPVKSRLQAPVNTKARQSKKRVEPAAR